MINVNLDHCLSFINSQSSATAKPAVVRRSVTISRQAGCGAIFVAERVAKYLDEHAPIPGVKWTIFDRQLMIKVLEDHKLPTYLLKILPEDRTSYVQDTLADIFNVHPTADKMVKLIAETILHLAEAGNAIIVGRGANIVTAKMPHVLHVRLVADLDDRIERVCQEYNKSPEAARRYCLEEDPARTRYLKSYFNTDINDPLHYHLVINTSRINFDDAARMIGEAAVKL